MKYVYPIVITPADEGGFVVFVPDLEINTQGESLAECLDMARDAIGLWGICHVERGAAMPEPSTLTPTHNPGDTVTLVDIDFDAYRRANDMRTIRRNVSLPSWLNVEAEKAGLNVSAVLQSALKQELRISAP